MRVLHIIAEITKQRGGPVSALAGILSLTEGLDVESSILTLKRDGAEHEFPSSVKIHRQPVSFPVRFLRSKAMLQWLDQNHTSFHLIVLHEIWPLCVLEAGTLLASVGANYLVMPHCSLDPFDLRKRSLFKQALGRTHVSRMLAQARCVVTATSLEAQRLECYGTRPEVKTLPLPVVLERDKGNRERFRVLLKATDADFVVVFVGRLDPKKGVDVLLRALGSCMAEHPELRLAIAGSGAAEYEAQLRALTTELGLNTVVTFLGFVGPEERADAFAGADLFALTSHYENYGMAVVEAMQSGLPVLISRGVFLARDIEGDRAGFICEDDPTTAAAALQEALTARSSLREWAERGRIFSEKLSPEALRPAYQELLFVFTSKPEGAVSV